MIKYLLPVFAVTAGVVSMTFLAPVTAAAHPVSFLPGDGFSGNSRPVQASQTGNDVSWPQCRKQLPSGQLFGIVGVNGGLANTTNPCFETEFAWAGASLGGTGQGTVAFYVNTANPGDLGVADWPTSGTSYTYGTCDGSDNQACAYQYGWSMAMMDATGRIGARDPGAYTWWLDVETGNSWEANQANNVADLEGMVDYFESLGAHVGLYSTSYQWGKIAGTVTASSSLYHLDSWLAGANNLSGAKANCTLPGLTGGQTTLAQYVSRRLDYDYSCI